MAAEPRSPGSERRIGVVVNPATRQGADRLVRLLRRTAPPGVALDIRLTTEAGSAVRLARELAPHVDLVVAAGGDGTVADVATGILGSGIPLGIVPGGSTNITARELGIPAAPARAIELLFGDYRLRAVDVGRCGDRCFLHMAGAGFDSRFFERTDRRLKRRIGWIAYLPPAALALRMPPARISVIADERTVTALSPLVVIANGGSIITPGLRLDPGIRSDDGWLDVLLFTAATPIPMARTLSRLATLRLHQSPFLWKARARHVELAAEPPLPLQLDGDVIGHTPASFSIAPRGIEVIVPSDRSAPRRVRL